MANEIKAVFRGDISPMEKAMAQLRTKMKADAEAMKRDLVIRPTVDANALKAAGASIQAELLKWKREAAKPIVIPTPQRDYAASNAYLDQQFARISDPSMMARRNAGGMKGGGMDLMNVGMMGQQVQDVAVQLQMGTSALTVFAQQAPQMLSFLGPHGMIVGGFASIAGAALTAGKSSKDTFDEMIAGASAAHGEVQALIRNGGLNEVSAAMEKINAQAATLERERLRTNGLSVQLGRLVGGQSPDERQAAIQEQQLQMADDRIALQRRLVTASAEELRIASLRAQGRSEEADAEERLVKLRERIRDIEASSPGGSTKQALVADEQKKFAINEGAIKSAKDNEAFAKRQAEREALKQAQEANARKQQELDDSQLDSAGQLKRVQEEIAKLKSLNDGADQMADAQRQSEIIDLLGKELSLRAQIKREREDSANKAAADDRDQMQKDEAYWDDQLDGVLKQEKQAAAKQSLVERAALTQLRSQGKNRLADKVEREMSIESRAKQIAQDTGLPMNQARDMAKTMTADEEKAARAAGRIQGGRSGGFEGLDGRKFDALDAMKKKGKLGDEFRFPLLDEMAKRQAADAQANKGKAQIQAPTLEQLMQQMITIWQTQLTLAS